MTMNTFKVKESVGFFGDLLIAANAINFICYVSYDEVRAKFIYQSIDLYVYHTESYDSKLLAKKVKKALDRTKAPFVTLDRGNDNSSAVKNLQLYCVKHIMSSILEALFLEHSKLTTIRQLI